MGGTVTPLRPSGNSCPLGTGISRTLTTHSSRKKGEQLLGTLSPFLPLHSLFLSFPSVNIPSPLLFPFSFFLAVHLSQCCLLSYRSDVSPSSSSIPEEQAVTNVPGHWLRFNDVLVDEFSLNDVAVEAECFGDLQGQVQ